MPVPHAAAGPATVDDRATSRPAQRSDPGAAFVALVVLLSGTFMLVAGVWALCWPRDFAEAVRFDYSEHFLHDAGAFQIGLGLGLLLALVWRDALATVLAAFLVSNTLHAFNHAIDLDIGGRDSDPWFIGVLSALVAVALWLRLRQLGYVAGYVTPATTPALAPFVEQKTVLLTSHRRNGTPVPTPVSLAVDGDHAVFRSYEKAGKTRRLRNDPMVEVAPSTGRGTPTGPAIRARTRRLEGAEAAQAARLLRRKHPGLQGVLVPLTHRVARRKTGRTVHFELEPVSDAGRTWRA